jgi:hypothetical protein
MIEGIVMHAPDDAELIRALLQLRERVADLDPALARTREGLPAAHQLLLLHIGKLELELMVFLRRRLAVEFGQRGLRIKSIHMTGAAVHEKVNHGLRLRGEVGRARGQRIRLRRRFRGLQPAVPRQQRGERDASESAPGVAQPIPAAEQ